MRVFTMEEPTLHRDPVDLGDLEVRVALEVREVLEGQEVLEVKEGNRGTSSPLKPLSSRAEVTAFSLTPLKVGQAY